MKPTIRSIALVVAAGAFAAGCVSDEKLDSTLAPPPPTTQLLARYVAMGNSITAGFQSGGINDSTQRRAYPKLLATMAGVPFVYPSFGLGCPALFTTPLNMNHTLTANIPGTGCALRQSFTGLVQNVAVPGEYVTDLTATGAQTGAGAAKEGAGPLNLFINGGLNEAQAMQAQHPTFVTLWAPNNDILHAVNVGSPDSAPSAAAYLTAFNAAVAAIKAVPTVQGAVLIGIVDVPDFAPIVQPGAYFFLARDGSGNFSGKPVDLSCSPVNQIGQPNPFGANLVSFHVLSDTSVHSIRCTPDAKYVTTTSVAGAAGGTNEYAVFEARIDSINAGVQAAAGSNWIYVNPNTFADQPGAPVRDNPTLVKKCQGLRTAATAAEFMAAVVNTCPLADAANPFGQLVSLDATHPSTFFHQQFASFLAAQINAKYHTTITTTAPASGAVLAR